jgi:hypothetical protein
MWPWASGGGFPLSDNPVSGDLAVKTALIYLGKAWVANSLCPEQGKAYDVEPEVQNGGDSTGKTRKRDCPRRRASLNATKRGAWLLAVLIFGLYLGWMTFSITPYSSVLTEVLSRSIPGWLATLNWGLCLVLAAGCMGPLAIPAYFRVTLYVLLVLSAVFLLVSFHFHPVASVLILVLGYAEIYWLIPWWEAKWNRDHEPR